MDWSEAGGIWKLFVSWVFMALPCWTENVWSWARMVLKMMVQAKIGMTDRITLTCSTWATVHSLHGLSLVGASPCALMQALSRNLKSLKNHYQGNAYKELRNDRYGWIKNYFWTNQDHLKKSSKMDLSYLDV